MIDDVYAGYKRLALPRSSFYTSFQSSVQQRIRMALKTVNEPNARATTCIKSKDHSIALSFARHVISHASNQFQRQTG